VKDERKFVLDGWLT